MKPHGEDNMDEQEIWEIFKEEAQGVIEDEEDGLEHLKRVLQKMGYDLTYDELHEIVTTYELMGKFYDTAKIYKPEEQ